MKMLSASSNPNCGPGDENGGEAVRLSESQKTTLVEYAQQHAPNLVNTIRRAEFYRVQNDWYALLDMQKNSINLFVHPQLWDELFG